jgi:uncharacterized membrane protein
MTDPAPPRRRSLLVSLRADFLTGLVVVLPIGLTVYLIWSVVGWLDGWFLPLLPEELHPPELVHRLFGPGVNIQIRGVGTVVFLVFTVLVGAIAKGIIGRSVIYRMELLVNRMPVVRSLYSGLKQIAETVFNKQEDSFTQTCLIEFPKEGTWCVGLVSARPKGEIAARLPEGDEMVSVYVGLTPFTSGFLVFVPKKDVILLDMTTEDIAKLVVSAGIVYPTVKA